MRCNLDRKKFLEKIQFVTSVIQMNRDNQEQFKNLYLNIQNNDLVIFGTNGKSELRIQMTHQDSDVENGLVAIEAQTITDLVSKLQSNQITLETNDNLLVVKSTNFQAKLKILDSNSFEHLINRKFNNEMQFSLTKYLIEQAVKKIAPSTAPTGTELDKRLMTVLFETHGDKIRISGTDTLKVSSILLP